MVLKDRVLCRHGRLWGSRHVSCYIACCRVEDGKAKLPVRIAQLLEQGLFLSTRHYCLGALAKKVRQGAVGKFSSFIILFSSRRHMARETAKGRADEHWCKEWNAPFRVLAAPEQSNFLPSLGSCWASWQGHLAGIGSLCVPRSSCGDPVAVVDGACPVLVALCVVVTL